MKSLMGLHPPVALGSSTMMIVANTAGQQPKLAASVMIFATARSASSQTCFRCRAGCKLSEPVAVCALNEPQTSRKSSRDGGGTTGAMLAPLKSIWHALPTC